MYVLLLHDTIKTFVEGSASSSDLELIRRVIEHQDNVFLLSRQMIDDIERRIDSSSLVVFQSLMTRLIDSGLTVPPEKAKLSSEDEVVRILATVPDGVVPVFSYNEPSATISSKIDNIAIISQQSVPNYHCLALQLAINHPNKVSVDSSMFGSDPEIVVYFKDIFRLIRHVRKVAIFDRETVAFTHGCLDSVKQCSVDYYTLRHKDYDSDERNIIKFFARLRIFSTRDRNLLHSRKIISEDLVVIADNSFNNLRTGGDWSIDVQFSPLKARRWLTDSSKYKREYPRR